MALTPCSRAIRATDAPGSHADSAYSFSASSSPNDQPGMIVIAVVMLGTLIAVTVLHLRLPTWNHWVLALEAVMILQFAVFWVLQSIDLWNGPYRLRVPKVTLPGLHQDAGDKAALG